MLWSLFYHVLVCPLLNFLVMFARYIFFHPSISIFLCHCVWNEFLVKSIYLGHFFFNPLCQLLSSDVFKPLTFKINSMSAIKSAILLFAFCLFSAVLIPLFLYVTWTYFRILSLLFYTVFECTFHNPLIIALSIAIHTWHHSPLVKMFYHLK